MSEKTPPNRVQKWANPKISTANAGEFAAYMLRSGIRSDNIEEIVLQRQGETIIFSPEELTDLAYTINKTMRLCGVGFDEKPQNPLTSPR